MAYIEKEPIVEFITKGLNNLDKEKAFGHDAIEILTEIEFAPTADVVEVKHGKNVTQANYVDEFICSECGIIIRNLSRYDTDEDYYYEYECKYCPNCGAKMDKEE